MKLSDDGVRAALFAVSDVVARRRMFGQPIPPAVVTLRQQLLIASACGSERSSEAEQLDDDLIDSDAAAEILGCSARWVRELRADLDGKKLAGRWVFHRRAVTDYAEGRNRDTD